MTHARTISARRAGALLLLLAATLFHSQRLPAQSAPNQAQPDNPCQTRLASLNAALNSARAAGDQKAEALALGRIGILCYRASDYPHALDSYNQLLDLQRKTADIAGQAVTLGNLGHVYNRLDQKQKALDSYAQALVLQQQENDRRGQATTLNQMGILYDALGDNENALKVFNLALPISRELGDRHGVAETRNSIGLVDARLGQKQNALDSYGEALSIFREVGDHDSEAATLSNIGRVDEDLGEKQKALDLYAQALALQQQVGDRDGQATTLTNIGALYVGLGEQQKALESLRKALPLEQEAGDRGGQAVTLNNIGRLYSGLGEPQKALDYYNQALPLRRATGDRRGEATTLTNIGVVYDDLGENQKAIDHYNQALLLRRVAGDRAGEATTLNDIGHLYNRLGEQQKALEQYNQALPILRETGNRSGEAITLNNIGSVYAGLAEKQKALDYLNQALVIQRAMRDPVGEATTLSNIGAAYDDLGQKQAALRFYAQALLMRRQAGDRGGEAATLNNIGSVYSSLGQKQKALGYFNQALPILRAVGNRGGQAWTLNNVALVYDSLGQKNKALAFYNQALGLATAVKEPLIAARILDNMMRNQKVPQPALAIFYGKQAVNLLQQVRGNIKGLDKQLQASFLASKEDYYHDLADLLITAGRLPEAQQVLDLLKQQEYQDYVRGETPDTLSPLTLTPAEQQAASDYQSSTAALVSLGEEWATLQKLTQRTPDQEKRFQQLSDQLDAAGKGLSDYYARLYVLLGQNTDANKQVADVKGEVSELQQEIADTPGTVALYTLVGNDRTSIIVITGSTAVAREAKISPAELNKKVAAFEQVLRNPRLDPRPLARELYSILVAPVKADLDQAHAATLVWSLDGALRYLPVAALYDGKQYLVEKYASVTITPASIPHLDDQPDMSNMSAAAMGISAKYQPGLPALGAVVGELDDIVKDAQVSGANGVLPGTILLNDQFTEKAMENLLGSRHAVVHIASHFVFKPGSDNESYLLLAGKDQGGAGYQLTVADFSSNPRLNLRHTDLLTLSACETGMSGSAANGREVDGLGTTAQLKGAKAVISSLWEVDDASTGALMADFYQRWVTAAGKVQKVEALRQAQLDLLLGKARPQADASGRGFAVAEPVAASPLGFAHPYYWAPFVLMGNWK